MFSAIPTARQEPAQHGAPEAEHPDTAETRLWLAEHECLYGLMPSSGPTDGVLPSSTSVVVSTTRAACAVAARLNSEVLPLASCVAVAETDSPAPKVDASTALNDAWPRSSVMTSV